MKYNFSLFLITASGLFISSCNHQPKQAETPEAPIQFKREFKNKIKVSPEDSTTIEWIDPVFQNLGNAKSGPPLNVRFIFKNTGNKPLIIDSIDAGCSCTLFDLPTEPILPGKEGKIVIRYETEMQPTTSINVKHIDVFANTRPLSTMRIGFRVILND